MIVAADTISDMPIDDIVDLYRQGYQLEESLTQQTRPTTLCSKCNEMKTQTLATGNSDNLLLTIATYDKSLSSSNEFTFCELYNDCGDV